MAIPAARHDGRHDAHPALTRTQALLAEADVALSADDALACEQFQGRIGE